MTTEPISFQLPTDDDLLADLRAVGVELREQRVNEPSDDFEIVGPVAVLPDDAARIDAMASVHLRRMAAIDRDVARVRAAYDLEVEMLRQRFERRVGPLTTERARHEAIVRDLARVQLARGGFGKKKSRDVGYGTYGVKAVPARLEVADEAAFVAYAETGAPDLLRITVKLPLTQAREYLTESELAGLRREVLTSPVRLAFGDTPDEGLPPGLRRTAPETETYAKPEPLP